ncbi:Melanoma inhibitory activity protein 3 [Microtus ochrogaster]|uniref:Melanoma inhibitory activity protein 3 n=1 Tax=Microtus ochrogaster TaxID=79684 RepID=A0A8J6G9Y5_MICOH|nr:Melanoma inhibitory activity protein 3 [Microtus ochrogaster]
MVREENIKSEWDSIEKENGILKEKKEQLQQQIEEWSKSHAELTEQIKSLERSQKDLDVALTHKDDNIKALTNCITQLNLLECELESEDQNEGGNESDELANGEVGDQIKKLEDDRNSLQTTKAGLEEECQTLRQKVEILSELYQQKEIALQKKLSQEEYERQDREQRLSAADEKVALAAEEVKTYNLLHLNHNAFLFQQLKARAADRAMAEENIEAANLRLKYAALERLLSFLEGRGCHIGNKALLSSGLSQNGSFGPSPVNMAPKGPPPFPGVPLLGGPLGGPISPPIRYGPPPQLCGPFGPRPVPPPFVAGMRPPVGIREYAPGVLPGKRDLPVDPREFLPGHTPFRPPGSLGPREFFIPPGTRLPPPTHGPQDYPLPPPAARDSLPSGPREEAPPASSSSVQDHSQASKPSP